jgi:hypothetical protein
MLLFFIVYLCVLIRLGTASCNLTYTGSGGSGVCRIAWPQMFVTRTTIANIQVLNDFAADTTQTDRLALTGMEWHRTDILILALPPLP